MIREVGRDAVRAAISATTVAHHLARHRVDRRLAHRQRQAGLGDRADALAGVKRDAAARRAARDPRDDQRAMRHVRDRRPASLMIPASRQVRRPRASCASANAGRLPAGQGDRRPGRGTARPAAPHSAALVAAVAQAPVVQPRRSGLPSGGCWHRSDHEPSSIQFATTAQQQSRRARITAMRARAISPRSTRADFPPFEPGTVWLVGAGPGAPG